MSTCAIESLRVALEQRSFQRDVICKFQATKPERIAKLEALCKTVKVP